MPQSVVGMCLVGEIDVSGLDIRPGCRVRALVISDPSYRDPESGGTEPELTLTEEEVRFWQTVLH
jgi:hypothetical protein